MMVRLQRTTPLPLRQNNKRIKHLIELAQVEPPSPKRKALVPQTPHVAAVGEPGLEELHGLVLRFPQTRVRTEGNELPEAARAVHFAEGIRGAGETVLCAEAGPELAEEAVFPSGPGMRQRPQHAEEGEGGEDGEEDIVRDDEGLEGARLAEAVGLVAALPVYAIPDDGGRSVEGGDRNGDSVVEGAIVDIRTYTER